MAAPRSKKRDDELDGEAKTVLKEFDCPECNANNPYDDGIHAGDEVRCYYCGMEFRAEITGTGRWRFREI